MSSLAGGGRWATGLWSVGDDGTRWWKGEKSKSADYTRRYVIAFRAASSGKRGLPRRFVRSRTIDLVDATRRDETRHYDTGFRAAPRRCLPLPLCFNEPKAREWQTLLTPANLYVRAAPLFTASSVFGFGLSRRNRQDRYQVFVRFGSHAIPISRFTPSLSLLVLPRSLRPEAILRRSRGDDWPTFVAFFPRKIREVEKRTVRVSRW